MHILFVCTANTCRSPMAAAICRMKVKDQAVEIRSAGIYAMEGESASVYAQSVLIDRGIYLDHATQKLSQALIEWADIILTMTQKNQEDVIDQFSDAQTKIHLLKAFAGDGDEWDIADPFGGNLTIYKQCRNEIEQAVDELLKKLGLWVANETEKGLII
jgi:protein-tyrosine-phosphatase